jgi:hypothetical protein
MEIEGVKARIDECFDAIAEFVGRHPKCPFCMNDEWARAAETRVFELRTVAEEKPTAEPLSVTALGWICTRCGFLRLHQVDPASWGMPSQGR